MNVLDLAPAGEETLLAGVDCLTGEIVWSTPNTLGYKMSHSSVMPMSLSCGSQHPSLGEALKLMP